MKQGQIRGLYKNIENAEKKLRALQENISKPNAKKRNKKQLMQQIRNILKDKAINRLFKWNVKWASKGKYHVDYTINKSTQLYLRHRIFANNIDMERSEVVK